MKLLLTPERLAEIKERCDETMFLVDLRGDTRDALDDIETLQKEIETLEGRLQWHIDERRIADERVRELEERILDIAFKYPEDGASTLSGFYQMAREVLNKK